MGRKLGRLSWLFSLAYSWYEASSSLWLDAMSLPASGFYRERESVCVAPCTAIAVPSFAREGGAVLFCRTPKSDSFSPFVITRAPVSEIASPTRSVYIAPLAKVNVSRNNTMVRNE
jgi:hypothetical protein